MSKDSSDVESINLPVFPSIIVSRSPHSLTPITGVPHAIDSTGDIPKSSSTGIYIVARDHRINDMSTSFDGASRAKIFFFHLIFSRIISFCGSFFPYEITRFLSGISIKASTIVSTRLGGDSLAQE